jgi:microcin C transport system substrate-binding protein
VILYRLLAMAITLGSGVAVATPEYEHGVSFFGEFKYPPHYEHFEYVNPDAPKGGLLVLANNTAWTSFIPEGVSTPGMGIIMGSAPVLYDGLFSPADDELGAFYGNLAESVMIADDFTWARIRLRTEARWHDGKPVTARDVEFTFKFLRDELEQPRKTRDNLQSAFGVIKSIDVHSESELTFHFQSHYGLNAGVVIMLGKIAILPEHYWRERDITRTTLIPPLGSGPYRVAKFSQSRFLLYERVPNYWGRHLPIHRGRHNFDHIRYDFYRDVTVEREAFRKGLVDYRQETDPRYWNDGYNIPARDKGWILMRRHNFSTYVGLLRGLVFNSRRKNLQDVQVREALSLAFDYDWYDRVITQGFYTRPESYFSHTNFAAVGLPDAAELALLAPFRDQLPKRLFTQPFEVTRSRGVGRNREGLLRARNLLRESGWTVIDGVLKNKKGEPFSLSFVIRSIDERRLITPYIDQLHRLGFKTRVRMVETSQYVNMMKTFNFDISINGMGIGHPPTLELIAYFHSKNALVPLTSNHAGIQNDAVDEMVMRVLNARSIPDLTAAQRALDRILLWNFYLIPVNAIEGPRVLYWDKFGRPPFDAELRTGFPETWWYDEAKASRIDSAN